MKSPDELKEIEVLLNKIDINLYIWVTIKTFNKFQRDSEILFGRKIYYFNETLKVIQRCETLIDVKKELTTLILGLPTDLSLKKKFLKELPFEYPYAEFRTSLKKIHSEKRLADFIYYFLDHSIDIPSNKNNNKQLTELLIASPQKKVIFYNDELVYFYSNNSPLLANLYLVEKYIEQNNCKKFFNTYLTIFIQIKKQSKTIIENHIQNKEFSQWLFDYIEKNIIASEMSYRTTYIPYTIDERKSFMLHQLDLWYTLDIRRYHQVLKKIQSTWNKRSHDARKRSLRLDSMKK